MKRLLALVTAAILLLGSLMACAETLPAVEASPESPSPAKGPAELFDVFYMNDESPAWLGIAVPVSEGIALTSAAVLPEDTRGHIAVSAGGRAWEATDVVLDAAGVAALIFYDEAGQPATTDHYTFVPYGVTVSAADLTVRSADEHGSRLNLPVQSVSPCAWQGLDCVVVQLAGGAVPGSPVLTDDGDLAALLVAVYAEGENRYMALTVPGIYQVIAGAAAASAEREHAAPEGYTVSVSKNRVTFDWAALPPEHGQEGETRYLVVADPGNRYLNYFALAEDQTSVTMILTPGRKYVSGLTWSAAAPDDFPSWYTVTSLPEAEPLTAWHFRSTRCAVAEGPEGGLKQGELPVPVSAVTEDLLRSGRAYFYSASAYEVTEVLEGLSLLITLTTPEGENYRYLSGWVYDPSYMDNDVWALPLSETGLLDSLNVNGYPAGEYELAFYVDGDLADRFTFTLP